MLTEPLVFDPDHVGEGAQAEAGYQALLLAAGGPAQPRDPNAPRPAPVLPDTSGLPPGLRLATGTPGDDQSGGMMDQHI